MSENFNAEQEEHQEESSAPAASEPEPEPSEEVNTPEFRAHVDRKPVALAAKYAPIYKVDSGVYLKGARSLKGPYTVAKVNSDGTYLLNDEAGKPFKDKVQERDLKPLRISGK